MKRFFISGIFILSIGLGNSSEFLPKNLLMLDEVFSHHVIVVNKSSHELYVYSNNDGTPELERTFNVATGKFKGDKLSQGDRKTPEGIYFIDGFHSSEELLKMYGKEGYIYGAGAFTLNYPNFFDRLVGKTGGGIWLHSTNDESRISKRLDSRGCVVAVDKDLFKISKFVELSKTPFIIVQDKDYLPKDEWQKARDEIKNLIDGWLVSWQTENFKDYISFYHKRYQDNFRKSYQSFSSYKKAVFSNPGTPEIEISNISIFRDRNKAIITFLQNYKSNSINDTGLKTLHLMQNKTYDWRIVNESWSKISPEAINTAFRPSQRFFNRLAAKQ